MPDDAIQLGLLDNPGPNVGAWRVRASMRARRLAVRVLPGGLVEIVVPRGTRPRMVEQFVARHRRWIERTLDLLLDDLRARHPEGAEAVAEAVADLRHEWRSLWAMHGDDPAALGAYEKVRTEAGQRLLGLEGRYALSNTVDVVSAVRSLVVQPAIDWAERPLVGMLSGYSLGCALIPSPRLSRAPS